jgi:hypothetical protein
MILIVADDAGRVEQVVTLGGSEALAQIYRDQGKRAAFVEQIPAGQFYLADGDVPAVCPQIEISDFDLKVGEEVSATVGATSVDVFFEGHPAGSETISGGKWSVEVDTPGTYTFLFRAAFPYADALVTKVAA